MQNLNFFFLGAILIVDLSKMRLECLRPVLNQLVYMIQSLKVYSSTTVIVFSLKFRSTSFHFHGVVFTQWPI